METTPDALAISAVDIRLPPFWTADPQLWFLQVEPQFTARRITAELTKYHHVVASLPPAIASEIRDLLVAPPAENAYTALKQLLIRRLTPSEPQRLQQLLHNTELGDRTPSQLLRQMRQLLHTDGATTTEADSRLLRELFLQRLPVNVRMILASAADKRLSELAELADSVLAVAPPSVAALQPDIAGRAPTTALHDIREQISRLADTADRVASATTRRETKRVTAALRSFQTEANLVKLAYVEPQRGRRERVLPNCITKAKSECWHQFIANQLDDCKDMSGLFYLLPFQKNTPAIISP
ncbi:hypothetical protein HPB50_018558 [Hyalomma asiaticum]|uniref:Uncharacterized protein n=1 Tax=Hyalomma asiaticum TaxID=266040 RepID=A0ACB7RQJ3_HYAAI|nr:hypothetical protein HPB50_018558 [Hyalomma asiaticum]